MEEDWTDLKFCQVFHIQNEHFLAVEMNQYEVAKNLLKSVIRSKALNQIFCFTVTGLYFIVLQLEQ